MADTQREGSVKLTLDEAQIAANILDAWVATMPDDPWNEAAESVRKKLLAVVPS